MQPAWQLRQPTSAAAAISHNHYHIATDSLTSLHQIGKRLLYPEKHRHHTQGDLKILILSVTLNPTPSFIKENLMPELPEMNVQMPLQKIKPAMGTASQLKQPSALRALALHSLILADKLLKKLISNNLALKLPKTALD